jgi:hypothetical protein
MTRNQVEDIRRVAAEVADLAVLLRAHGLGHLANRLHSVQQALQYVRRNTQPRIDDQGVPAKVILLEKYRRLSVNPAEPRA